MNSFLAAWFNLLVLLFFLFYQLRKPIQDFIYERHKNSLDIVNNTREKLQMAQKEHAVFSRQLASLQQEIEKMKHQAQSEFQPILQAVELQTHQEAERMIQEARQMCQRLVKELRQQLLLEASDLLIQRIETLLLQQVSKQDQLQIQHEFLSNLQEIA